MPKLSQKEINFWTVIIYFNFKLSAKEVQKKILKLYEHFMFRNWLHKSWIMSGII